MFDKITFTDKNIMLGSSLKQQHTYYYSHILCSQDETTAPDSNLIIIFAEINRKENRRSSKPENFPSLSSNSIGLQIVSLVLVFTISLQNYKKKSITKLFGYDFNMLHTILQRSFSNHNFELDLRQHFYGTSS